MKSFIVLCTAPAVLSLALVSSARAWESACENCGADMSWSHSGGLDEHRQLTERAMANAGVPEDYRRAFSLKFPARGGTLANLSSFEQASGLTLHVRSPAEFSLLPDLGYTLGDWALAFRTCPPNPGADPARCHRYSDHLGPLNASHFLPQAETWYRHYHGLAVTRGADCAGMRADLGARLDDFQAFFDECVAEALSIEAFAQHFLQDAWSSGHMWERWGGASIGDLGPGLSEQDALLNGLAVALTAGIIHGTEPQTRIIEDALCGPDPDVRYQPDLARAVGDWHMAELLSESVYSDQALRLTTCTTAGFEDVYARVEGRTSTAPGAECFSQRATNRAMLRGFEDYGLMAMAADLVPNGDPALELSALVAVAEILRWKQGRPGLSARYNQELRDMYALLRVAAEETPDGTLMAEGRLGPLLGVTPNSEHNRLPAYVDPELPWSPMGDPGEQALTRLFHRSHAAEFCEITARDTLDALRALAANDAGLAEVCVELVRRHVVRVSPMDEGPAGDSPSAGTRGSAGCPPGAPPDPRLEGGLENEHEEEPQRSLCELLGKQAPVIEVESDEPELSAFELASRWCRPEEDQGGDSPCEQDCAPNDDGGDALPGGVECDPDPPGGGGGGPDGGGAGLGGPGGVSAGDPHLKTFDGLGYDFQAQGELVLARSTEDGFEVQARQLPAADAMSSCTSVTWNAALALRLDAARVTFDADRAVILHVNGAPVRLAEGASLVLGNARLTRVVPQPGTIEAWHVSWSDGSTADILRGHRAVASKSAFHIRLLPSAARAGKLEGLLGNFDGDILNDLTGPDGAALVQDVDGVLQLKETTLYGVWADRYRVSEQTSLFDYEGGMNSASYQRPDLPSEHPRLEHFSQAEIESATEECSGANVQDASWHAACVLDVVCSSSLPSVQRGEVASVFAALDSPVAGLMIVGADTVAPDGGTAGGDGGGGASLPPGSSGSCEVTCQTAADCYVNGVADLWRCQNGQCGSVAWAPTCDNDLDCKTMGFVSSRCTTEADCPTGNVCAWTHEGLRFGSSDGECLMRADLRGCGVTMDVITQSGQQVAVCGRSKAYCEARECRDCREDADCSPGRPYCAAGKCGVCRQDGDCGGERPLCSAGSCVECVDDTHCGGRFCTSGTCACAADADCDGTERCRDRRCVCGSDADCPSSPGQNHCDVASGICGCASAAECVSLRPGFQRDLLVCRE